MSHRLSPTIEVLPPVRSLAGKRAGADDDSADAARGRAQLTRLGHGLLERADAYFDQANYPVARDFLMLASQSDPDNAEVLITLGSVQFQLGEFAPAGRSFIRAGELQPEDASVFTRLALVHSRLGHAVEFLEMLTHALSLDPSNIDALRLAANYSRDQGHYAQAARLLARMLEQYPSDIEALLSLAKCFYQTADFATAQTVLERVLEFEPGNTVARENLAVISRKTAPTHESCAPDPARLDLVSAADEAFGRGDLATARDHLRRAVEANPRSVDLLLTLGNVEFQLNEFSAAYDAFNIAAGMQPDNVNALIRLAAASLRVQRREVFDAALVRALDLEPANLAALTLLGNTRYQQGRYIEAAKAYFLILHQTRNDVGILLALGNCFHLLKDRDNACLTFEEVLRIDPGNATAAENLKVAAA